jgi:hypothetical protein
VEGLQSALAPYNVLVTSVRPPEYVPYQMLLPSDEVNAESLSRTCAGAAIDCDGVQRNDIAFTSGGSMFCMNPDAVQAALIAFGYMSGLENNDNPMDPMFYQASAPFGPDFTMPALAYDDSCSNLVQTVDDMEMTNPLQCAASVNHEPYCDGMDNQANSHAELLAYYGMGPAPEDTTPPTVSASVTGIILGIFSGAGLLVRLALPHLIARLGNEGVLAASFLASAACYLLFPLVHQAWLLCVLAFACGLVMSVGQPITMALSFSNASDGRSGAAMGLRQTVNHFTRVSGPLLFGSIGSLLGPFGVFWINAAMLAAGASLSKKGKLGDPAAH